MTIVLTVSLCLQVAAAVLALRLIRLTGRRTAWLLVAVAIALMAMRRGISLYNVLDGAHTLDPAAELVSLCISILMVAGIGWIAPMILSIRRTEMEVTQLLEFSPEAMVLADHQDRIVRINAETVRLFGYSREQLIGQDVQTLIPERFRGRHRARRAKYHEQPRPRVLGGDLDVFGLRKDGTEFPVEVSVSPLETADGMLVVSAIRDISVRVEKDAALRESEERHRSLMNDVLDSSSVAVCILDNKFDVVWVNRAFESYFDLPRREVVGFDARRIVNERLRYIFENPKEFHDKIFATYDNNSYVEHFECHVLPENGRKELWLEHWSQPIESGLYSGGRIEHYTDVTERKEADTRVRFFGRIARNMQIGLIVYRLDDVSDDHSLRIVAINPEGESLIGIPSDELLGKRIDDAFPNARATGLPKLFAEVHRTGEARSHNDFNYGDDRVLENVWSFKTFPLPDQCVGVVFEKTTERVHADKLVQNIAAGVAGAKGEEFFRSLVVNLAKTLDMEFAFVGELADGEKTKVQTVVMRGHGEFMEDVLYSLDGTPCANVTAGRVACHPKGVQESFPEDELLQELGVESYLGTPLFDSSGTPIGLMSVMGCKPLANPDTAMAVLRIFASRAAAELERRRESALKSG